MAGRKYATGQLSRRPGGPTPEQSGNPGEQPRKLPSFRDELEAELAEKTRVWEGDRELIVSKQRGLVKMLVRNALRGDMRAAATIVSVARSFDGDETDMNSDESDRRQLKQIIDEEIARRGKASTTENQ